MQVRPGTIRTNLCGTGNTCRKIVLTIPPAEVAAMESRRAYEGEFLNRCIAGQLTNPALNNISESRMQLRFTPRLTPPTSLALSSWQYSLQHVVVSSLLIKKISQAPGEGERVHCMSSNSAQCVRCDTSPQESASENLQDDS